MQRRTDKIAPWMNRDDDTLDSPLNSAAKNRRIYGQRRKGTDRRKVNLDIDNCRRQRTSDRRSQFDRRPTLDSKTILRSVPQKKRFFSCEQQLNKGRFINISV